MTQFVGYRLAGSEEAVTQKTGKRPMSVEVGMLLCRPCDGLRAEALRVVLSGGPVARCTFVGADGSEVLTVDLAVAAIVHPDGGWILAADWHGTVNGEGER